MENNTNNNGIGQGKNHNNRKKLFLSDTDNKLAGVCGGFADYFNIDSTVIRLLYIFITIATGILPGVIAYLVAWATIPRSQKEIGSL